MSSNTGMLSKPTDHQSSCISATAHIVSKEIRDTWTSDVSEQTFGILNLQLCHQSCCSGHAKQRYWLKPITLRPTRFYCSEPVPCWLPSSPCKATSPGYCTLESW